MPALEEGCAGETITPPALWSLKDGGWGRSHDAPPGFKFNPDRAPEPTPNTGQFAGRRVTVVKHADGTEERLVDRDDRQANDDEPLCLSGKQWVGASLFETTVFDPAGGPRGSQSSRRPRGSGTSGGSSAWRGQCQAANALLQEAMLGNRAEQERLRREAAAEQARLRCAAAAKQDRLRKEAEEDRVRLERRLAEQHAECVKGT
eukprot:9312281-Alexandrium_andersonii.AAC.1